MNTLYQKITFLLELFVNGIFIVLYLMSTSENMNISFISSDLLEQLLFILKYIAPFIVLGTIFSYYLTESSLDSFIRKYIFSLICIFPMFLTLGDLQFTFWLSAVHLFASVLSLYESSSDEVPEKIRTNQTQTSILERIKLAPAQIVIISFCAIIAFGTVLLSLPIAAADGIEIGFVDAFFTATSATCVTGLSTLSLSDNFSFAGQIVVLILIQVGGLGYMTLYSSMTILLGKSLAVSDKVMMQDLLDISSFEDLVQMIVNIVKYTLVIEIIGAIILTVAFTLEGLDFSDSLYYGIFHSISAFCNAGFALFNDSLVSYGTNPLIHGTISILIFLGGLGFIVLKELEFVIFKGQKIINLSVHSKIVLTTNIALVFLVAIYIFFGEYLNGLNTFEFWEKIQFSIFQSITTRTAGFNTIDFSNLHPHTIYFMSLIMFIGASPGSTGGGIKTTTFAILFQSVKATLRGREQVEFFERRVPNMIVVRAIAIIVISLIIVSFFILLMMRLEPEHDFLAIFFEVVSAFATVGLSLGITPYLSAAGKVAMIILMFIGRVGPLTLALAIGKNRKESGKVDYPEGRVMIG